MTKTAGTLKLGDRFRCARWDDVHLFPTGAFAEVLEIERDEVADGIWVRHTFGTSILDPIEEVILDA